MDFFEILDFLIPAVLIFYGFRWLMTPPEFKSTKGLVTKYSQMSEESWALAHAFGGKLAIAFGIVMLALAAVKRFITAEALLSTMTFATIIINLVLIFSLIPIINLYVKKKSK